MIGYFDSCALVKLFIEEAHSDLAAEMFDAASIAMVSRLAYPEIRAALAAAMRGNRLSAKGLRQAVSEWDDLWEDLHIIEVTAVIALRAGELAEGHGLRGYDAIHLSSALAAASEELVLVTWDRDLHVAASAAGLAVAPASVSPS